MNNNKAITKVYELINCGVRNSNFENVAKRSEIICIEFVDGTVNYLDVKGGVDITNIEYLDVIEYKTPKKRVLFDDYNNIAKKRLILFGDKDCCSKNKCRSN